MSKLLDWLDHRTGYRSIVREALYEPIPGGARWRYVWGSTLVFTFFVQLVTGLFLWTAYSPSAQTAWESVYYIEDQMTLGWVVRGVHHFTASAMVVLLALHFMQVVVDGAYKAPREINFWLGLVLMLIVLALALTGYLLPWDQKGYYATRVATNIMAETPGIGPQLQELVQGGPEYGHHTLTRFFALHAGMLPLLLLLFLAAHIYVFRRHAVTPAEPAKQPGFAVALCVLFGPLGMFYASLPAAMVMLALAVAGGWGLHQLWLSSELSTAVFLGICAAAWLLLGAAFSPWAARSARRFQQDDSFFWPDQVLKDAVACLAVLACVLGLTYYFQGAGLTAPADPSEFYKAARPEWYFLFLFQFLKHVEHLGVAFGAIYVPAAVMLMIALMPFIGRWKLGHRFNVALLMALMIAIVYFTAESLYEDAQKEEFQTAKQEAEELGARAMQLARAYGVPPTGVRTLLRSDPLVQGPELFKRNCAACHRYDGHDGTGEVPEEKPTAADLGDFGTREWTKSVLTRFREHFAAFHNSNDKRLAETLLEFGEMAAWSASETGGGGLKKNDEQLNALLEFLAAQSGRRDLAPYDPGLVAAGRKVFNTYSCADCHSFREIDTKLSPEQASQQIETLLKKFEEAEDELGYGAPSLTGYGGAAWLKRFIANPDRYYRTDDEEYPHNFMPSFKDRLTGQELDLLVRWLVNDYYQPPANGED